MEYTSTTFEDVTDGDRVRVTIGDTVITGKVAEVCRSALFGALYVDLGESQDAIRVEDTGDVVLEKQVLSNLERFNELPLGGKFILDGYREHQPKPTEYVKVAQNAYVALTPWDLHPDYFANALQAAPSLRRPEDIHATLTIKPV